MELFPGFARMNIESSRTGLLLGVQLVLERVKHNIDLTALSDQELIMRLKACVIDENESLSKAIVHIAEFDKRRLHGPEGQPSCFIYCTKVLGYSEDAAYRRITVARLSRKCPAVLDKLESGEVSLSAVSALAPHMTPENCSELLERAKGKTRQEVESMVAELAPQPDSSDVIRWIYPEGPQPRGMEDFPRTEARPDAASEEAPAEPARASVEPLYLRQSLHPSSPGRVRFAFTGSEDLLNLLRRAQEVLKAKYPAGELELIFKESLELLLDKKDPERRLRAKEEKGRVAPAPRPEPERPEWALGRRHIPQRVKDEVWRRDGGQCAYIAPGGGRCLERGGLEFDHVVPFALGGPSNNPGNIRLLCRAHNQMFAHAVFGFGKCRPVEQRKDEGIDILDELSGNADLGPKA